MRVRGGFTVGPFVGPALWRGGRSQGNPGAFCRAAPACFTGRVIVADPALDRALTDAVGKVEARTACELVVVLAPRAEPYRDLAYLAAGALVLATLGFAIFSPFPIRPEALLVELPLVFVASAWLARRMPWLLRRMASRDRQDRAVDRAAKVAFHEEALTGTRDRIGILFYYAGLEDRLRILADAGVLAATGEAVFVEAERAFGASTGELGARLAAALEAPAARLAERLPRRADDVNELPDAPRIRKAEH